MPEQTEKAIVEGTLMSEPHIAGRRVSVLTIHDRVEKRGLEPKTVADRLDLDIADVHRALAYYYDNPAKMQELEEERQRIKDQADRSNNDPVTLE